MPKPNPLEDLEIEPEVTNKKTPWYKTRVFKISSAILGAIAITLIVLFNKPIGDLLNSLLLKAAKQLKIITLNNFTVPLDSGLIFENGKLKLSPVIPVTRVNTHVAAYFIPTQNDLDFISTRFSLIIGSFEHGAYVADFLKSINPAIITLGYRDIVVMHEAEDTYEDWTEVNQHEDWFIHTVDCDIVPNECTQTNRIQEPVKGGYLMNVASIGWRTHYANYVVNKLNSPSHINYDGVFSDDVWLALPFSGWLNDKHPSKKIRDNWYNNMTGMVSYVKSQLPSGKKIIINTSSPDNTMLGYASGAMNESFVHAPWEADKTFKTITGWKKDVDALIGGLALDKQYLAQSGMLGTNSSPAEKQQMMLFTLSSYLLGSGNKSTYSFKDYHNPGYDKVFFYPEWDVDLGRPTEQYELMTVGNNIYKRKFSKGLVLVNPSNISYTQIDLDKSYRTLDGQIVDSIDMPPHSGVILTNN